jgi:hypothetical protein
MEKAMIAALTMLVLSTGTLPANVVCDVKFPVGSSFVPYCTNNKPGRAVRQSLRRRHAP